MKNKRKWLAGLGLLFSLLFSYSAFAQMTQAEINNLLQLAEQFKLQHANERKEVEAFALRYNLPLEVRDQDGQVVAVLDRIVNGQAVYQGSSNVVSQQSASADQLKTGGGLGLNLSGAGQVLGIWEATGTALATHQEFGGRLTNLDGTPSTRHATHVAGTMIAAGMNANAQGFSHAATLRCYDSGGDNGEMANEAAMTPIRVSNHSYGDFAGWDFDMTVMPNVWRWFGNPPAITDWKFGAYDAGAQAWDNIAFSAPLYLIVHAAGNDRNDFGPAPGTTYNLGFSPMTSMLPRNTDGGATGFDCIPTQGNAKNTLTVGAANPIPGGNGYTGPNSVTITNFSGWGPTDDGRIKPDVVADGFGLTSSTNVSNMSYGLSSGTSMAAPSTSGTVGLLLEHWADELGGVPRAATMKALLINEADEVGPNNGPDYQFGWGHINAADAAQTISIHNYIGCEHIIEASVAAGNTFTYNINNSGTHPLKITLVWNDPASLVTNGGTVDPPGVNYLVNDLDLRLDGGASTFLPWVLNPAIPANAATTGNNTRDNVEQILLLNPAAGSYTIRVVAPAVLTSGPQRFSLVINGNDAVVDNAVISFLTISDNRTYAVRQNLTFGPSLEITNTGDVNGYAGESIRLVPGFHARAGSRFLARILPGGGCGIFTGDLKTDNYPGSKPVAENRQAGITDFSSRKLAGHKIFKILPNPAVDAFTIQFNIEEESPVNISLVNAQGQIVAELLSNVWFKPGDFTETFQSKNLAPGHYFCILQYKNNRDVQPLLIVPN